MDIKYKKFHGGHRFTNFKGEPVNNLVNIDIPEKVIIPLREGFGSEVPPLIKAGDKVKAGEIIARDDSIISNPVISSVNGTVKEITKINYFKRETGAVVIEADGSSNFKKIEGHTKEWANLSSEKIERIIYESGVSSHDREGIPTRHKSSIISPNEVEDVIIHGVGSEVYNLSLDVLLRNKNLMNFIEGVEILKKVLNNANFHLAFNKEDSTRLEEIKKLTAHKDRIQLYGLEPNYPQGYDEVLIPTVLGKKFPYGYSAANIGVVILNIQAVLQVYQAVAEGKPLIDRMIALCGPGFKDNSHALVRIGTPLENIIRDRVDKNKKLRFIYNSPLTGWQLSETSLPVSCTFSHIIAIPEKEKRSFMPLMDPGSDKDSYSKTFLSSLVNKVKQININKHGEKRPCIKCNYCQEVCPVSIIPHYIYQHVERGLLDPRLLDLRIYDCIECNLCSYVCPSKIPVSSYIKEGKEKLKDQGCDNSLCVLPFFDLKGLEEYRGIK